MRYSLLFLIALGTLGCYKPLDLNKSTIPPKTLVIEFADPVRFVVELKINGDVVPVDYAGKNRFLIVENLPAGRHDFNIDSIAYVFGPEYEKFEVTERSGAYFFVQGRKYRSALPTSRSQLSIRAYRRELKEQGIEAGERVTGQIRAYFSGSF